MVQDLLAAKRDLKLCRYFKTLSRYEVLVLDGLGYAQQGRDEMEVLFSLLSERYERGSVIIEQPGVLGMGGDFQGRDDDCGGDRPAGASLRDPGVERAQLPRGASQKRPTNDRGE